MTGNTRLAGPLALVLVLTLAATALAGPLEKAKALAEDGKWAEAADLYARVLEKDTANREAAIGLSEAAPKAGKPELYFLAEDALLGLKEKNEKDWDVRLALGEISLATAATKTNTVALSSYHDQAKRNFEAARAGLPSSERAAVGLARTFFEGASFQKAADTIDAYLAGTPESTAKALYWKGQAYYFMGIDAFRQGGNQYPLSAEATAFFQKAQGAYLGSTKADETSFDAWMQLAYASQYLGDREGAQDAYAKALPLNAESDLPLRGLQALLQHDAARYALALQKLADEHPKHPQLLLHFARTKMAAKDYASAIKLLKAYVKVAKNPAKGWYELGRAYDFETEEAKAVAAFRKALEHDPENVFAAWELDRRIQDGGAVMARAAQSVKGAQAVIKEYEALMKLAPRNASVRNNLAFTLREAYGRHQGDGSWKRILEKCVEVYTEASAIIGEWNAERERTWDWQLRWSNAQIISDTGLMYQFYDETRDLEKAETYYDRALEFTDNGYRDAFNNLSAIYTQQKRWRDLYDLAAVCAESIMQENGQPDGATRARAEKIMRDLRTSGRVRD
jgi:tetratricopeptide (TPR) repeat protein